MKNIINFLIRLSPVLTLGRIKLKMVDDDKFLGAVKDKLQLVDYKDALSIKLSSMKDISEKNMEAKDGKALTETGFWFFPKSYSMKKNSKSGKQAFRIVYYAPNEYLLMRGDSCLGFVDGNKFKKVDCALDKAARFRICHNKLCDNYLDIKSDLECIKMFLGMNPGGGRGDDTTSSSDDERIGKASRRGGKGKHKGKENGSDDSDSNDIANCKDYLYDKRGRRGGRSRRHGKNGGRHSGGYYPNNYMPGGYYPNNYMPGGGQYPGGGNYQGDGGNNQNARPFSPWGESGCNAVGNGNALIRPENSGSASGLTGILNGSHLFGINSC